MTDAATRHRHEPTVARNLEPPLLGAPVVACECGWKATTINQLGAEAQLRAHLASATTDQPAP